MDKRNAEIYVLSIYTMFFFVSILIRLENGIFCRPWLESGKPSVGGYGKYQRAIPILCASCHKVLPDRWRSFDLRIALTLPWFLSESRAGRLYFLLARWLEYRANCPWNKSENNPAVCCSLCLTAVAQCTSCIYHVSMIYFGLRMCGAEDANVAVFCGATIKLLYNTKAGVMQ